MYLSGLKVRAEIAAKRTIRSAVGLVFLLVGLGFLTAAGFIVLAEIRDALFAALVIGAIYVGLGLVAFGWAAMAAYRVQTPSAAPAAVPTGSAATAVLPALLEAFFVGLSAGIANRRTGGGRDAGG